MASTIAVDISDYGYKGKIVSIREPTGGDILALTDFMNREKKTKGDVNQFLGTLFLLNRLIVDPPFDTKIDSLKELPLRLLQYLDAEVEQLIVPLPKKEEANY